MKLTQKKIGKLSLSIYEFEKKGEEIPIHNHEPGHAHLTIVNKGKLYAYGEKWKKTMTAGNVVIFPARDPHGFKALENNTKITNIFY
jgi:quercetin dioxygenase-like cupin family protein